MRWAKLASVVTDFPLVVRSYALDSGRRNRMRELLKRDGMTPKQHALVAAEAAAALPAARPYTGLASTSLTLAAVRLGDAPPRLNLLIGEVRDGGMFAGVHTALGFAIKLSKELSIPLRVLMLDFTSPGNDRQSAERTIALSFPGAGSVEVVPREDMRAEQFGRDDLWLATHSKTAHAAQVANASGLIDASRVVYLIQDYEPGFSPWSTESVLAAATYHAGFLPVVNSMPLWHYLCSQEDLVIDEAQVIAPSFESARLETAALARTPRAVTRVLFYARPSKHRNLYQLGISALRAAVLELGADAASVEFYSAGEEHDEVQLGPDQRLVGLGRLPWNEYFDFLSSTDVVLSLQQSPHPSHPPFDAAISGAVAVTNEFHGTRAKLHPRIVAVPADTAHLGGAVANAIRQSKRGAPGHYLPVADGLLGHSIDEVIRKVASRLRS
jgi:hypothetical protein